MSWWEWAAIGMFLLGFFAMGAVLAVRLYRNPFLLAGLIPVIWKHVKKPIVRHILPVVLRVFKRYDPETEAAWRDCERKAGKWNFRTRRCE